MIEQAPSPLAFPRRGQSIELDSREQATLKTIIDLLIPADEDFPPPSSLQLIDELIPYFRPHPLSHNPLLIKEQRLRSILSSLNTLAGGDFCGVCQNEQQHILRQLEQQEPAFFQMLWTLVNHSYYARLAKLARPTATATP